MLSLRPYLPALIVATTAALTGCRDREVVAYRAPKDPPQAATPAEGLTGTNNLPAGHPTIGPAAADAGGAAMVNTPVPTATGADLTWTAPAGWTTKPPSAMRKGSFTIAGDGGEADLSITAFPGSTGGLEANLNRWRGQVGLAPTEPAEVAAAAEKFSSNGLDFVVVNYSGGEKRLLGAIVAFGGNTWFFKMLGPDRVVAAQKDAFTAFLHTVKAPGS